MNEYTEFEEKETDGETFYLAEPATQDREPIRIESDWFDHEPGEPGKWEQAVGEIIRADLLGDLELSEDAGKIDRSVAAENLQEAEFVQIEDQAHAILDFFDEQGALEIEGDSVKLLTTPENLADEDALGKEARRYRMLNWAAAMNACIDQMEQTLQDFEDAKERLEENSKDLWNEVSTAEENLKESIQELKALGPGSGFAEIGEVDPENRDRYRQLKDDVAFYNSLTDIEEETLVEIDNNISDLASEIDRLEAVQETFERKVTDIRKKALRYEIFPEEEMGMATSLRDIAAALTDVETEAGEDLDVDELEDIAASVSESATEVAEAVDEKSMEESQTTINQ